MADTIPPPTTSRLPRATLRLLGGVALEVDGVPVKGAASQRHKLALLALLARAPGLSMTRDKLMALLWPERDIGRARSLLSAAAYAIRQSIGADALVSSEGSLRLDPTQLAVDVVEMEALEEEGDLRAAAEAYSGAFLDGFHLSDATDFSHWVDEQRASLAERHQRLLERLAEESTGREAVEWRRRIVGLRPYSPGAVLSLIDALDTMGEWPAALQAAERYQEIVRSELNVPPDPRIVAVTEEIRARNGPTVASPDAAPASPPGAPGPERETVAWSPAAPDRRRVEALPEPVAVASAPAAGASRRVRRPWAWGTAAVVAVTAAAFAFGDGASPETGDPNLIAVLPFSVHASPELEYLGQGMMDLLSAKLNDMGPIRSADPNAVAARASAASIEEDDGQIAAALGAGLFVSGSVIELGTDVELQARLRDARGNTLTVATTTRPLSELASSVDDLARSLLADQIGRSTSGLQETAALTTRSLDGLRSYLKGEQALRTGDHALAASLFEEAVEADPDFALGWYRLALVRDLESAGLPWWEDALDRRAIATADALPFVERRLIETALMRPPDAVPELEELIRAAPTHAEVAFRLGRALLRSALGGAERDERAVWALRRALDLDPTHGPARTVLAFAEARAGNWDEVESLARSGDEESLYPRAYLAFASDDSVGVQRLLDELAASPAAVLDRLAIELTVLFPDQPAAEGVYRLATAPERPTVVRAGGFRRLADLAVAKGRWREAGTWLDEADRLTAHPDLMGRARLAFLPGSPIGAETASQIRAGLVDAFEAGAVAESRVGGLPGMAVNAALLSVHLEDPEGVRSSIEMLRTLEGTPDGARVPFLIASLEAEEAFLAGRYREVVERLEALVEPNANQRYLLARALDLLGDAPAAMAWYESYPDLSDNAATQLGWRAASLAHLVRIRVEMGDVDGARRDLDALRALWRDADAEVAGVLADAERVFEGASGSGEDRR